MLTYTAALGHPPEPLLTRSAHTHSDTHAMFRIRPMERSDDYALDEVFNNMSTTSRYLRYHNGTPRLPTFMRRALLNIDGERHAAFLAQTPTPTGWRPIGIARSIRIDEHNAEVAIEVADDWQRHGVALHLLHRLHEHATQHGYTHFHGHIISTNTPALALMRNSFRHVHRAPDDHSRGTSVNQESLRRHARQKWFP